MATHSLNTNLMLGYHGCSRVTGEAILSGEEQFEPSANDYDWLGHGVYFWEANPHRAFDFVKNVKKYDDPFVIGAVFTLGNCLDTMNTESLEFLLTAHKAMESAFKRVGVNLPVNTLPPDMLKRELDCAVVNVVHRIIETTKATPIDSVRGLFFEGMPLYENSGFRRKTHTQIAIKNLNCIKGVFRVNDADYLPVK